MNCVNIALKRESIFRADLKSCQLWPKFAFYGKYFLTQGENKIKTNNIVFAGFYWFD